MPESRQAVRCGVIVAITFFTVERLSNFARLGVPLRQGIVDWLSPRLS
jgi:hypothetical protein